MSIEDDVAQLRTHVQQLTQHQATELQNLRDEFEAFKAALPEGAPGRAGKDVDAADVIARIRTDPQLRELLRGPRGLPGLDGKNGAPGHDGKDIIREVRISG